MQQGVSIFVFQEGQVELGPFFEVRTQIFVAFDAHDESDRTSIRRRLSLSLSHRYTLII